MYNTFELEIKYKYVVVGYSNLIFWKNLMINKKSGKIKKQCYNGGMIGYWLDSKTFKSIKWIKENLEEIKTEKTPF